MVSDQTRIELSSRAEAALVDAVQNVRNSGWELAALPADLSFETLFPSGPLSLLAAKASKALKQNGFVVISLRRLLDSYPETVASGAVTLLLSAFGTPIRVFANIASLWRQIDVDLTRPPNRSRGIGALRLHMDFVNAENPPDLICLLCMRPDPRGGGSSLLARVEGVESHLGVHQLSTLSDPIYRDGAVVGLNGIGEDMNPFPVFSPGSRWRYRYTANLLNTPPTPDAEESLRALARVLEKHCVAVDLARGDCLIVDQHSTLHGRLPLGSDQSGLPPSERRLVLHAFIRKTE